MKIVFCSAMYNEESVAQLVMDGIIELLDEIEIISFVVVNDGSTDRTSIILESYAHKHLNIIKHNNRSGIGACIYTGLQLAQSSGATHFGFLPGNGRIEVSEIKKLLSLDNLNQPEYLMGSRFLHTGYHQGIPGYRKVLIQIFSASFSFLLKIKLTDISCGLRLISLHNWDHSLDVNFLKSQYSGEQILTLVAIETELIIREVGINLVYSPLRPYSHLKFLDLPQIIWPWIRYIVWKKAKISFLKPDWLYSTQ